MLFYPLINLKYKRVVKINLNLGHLDGPFVTNLDEYESVKPHWIGLHLTGDNGSTL